MVHPLVAKLQTVSDLPADDLAFLTGVHADVRAFDAHSDVIGDGDQPDHVHLMMTGWTCRYKLTASGTRQITALLLPGDFCDAHITQLRRMDHGIGTLGPAEVAFIPRDVMTALTDRPAIAKALWWASLVDEGVLRAWIVNLGRRQAMERVAHLMCELHARMSNVGKVTALGFNCPMTQEDLADATGLTPVHVNRVLRRLREQGLMTLKLGFAAVTDPAGLRRMADFDPGYLHLNG